MNQSTFAIAATSDAAGAKRITTSAAGDLMLDVLCQDGRGWRSRGLRSDTVAQQLTLIDYNTVQRTFA